MDVGLTEEIDGLALRWHEPVFTRHRLRQRLGRTLFAMVVLTYSATALATAAGSFGGPPGYAAAAALLSLVGLFTFTRVMPASVYVGPDRLTVALGGSRLTRWWTGTDTSIPWTELADLHARRRRDEESGEWLEIRWTRHDGSGDTLHLPEHLEHEVNRVVAHAGDAIARAQCAPVEAVPEEIDALRAAPRSESD